MTSFGLVQATEAVSDSFTTEAQPTIIVETFNGKINVEAISDDRVDVTVTKTGSGNSRAGAEADLKNIEVTLTQDGNTIRITARRTNQNLVNNSGAAVDVKVPAGSNLDLTTSNGAVTSTGVSGDVKMTSSNGALSVKGGQGVQRLTTSNGAIQVEAQDAQVNAQTSNGSITFGGTLLDGNHSFDTSNGSIEISLPADSQFSIDASTSNGRISSDFSVTSSGAFEDNQLRGTVGNDSGVSITAETSNGSIKLLKSK